MSVPSRAITRTNESTEQLWQIAESGELTELEAILKKGADVNGCNCNGVTALMRAASAGHHDMVRDLLEHGADIDAHRDDGFTALLLATFFGHAETVRVLVDHGASLDKTTRCGNAAEDWAKARAFEDIASYLHDARRIRRTPAPPFFKQNIERPVTKPVVVEGVFSDQIRKSSVEPTFESEPEVQQLEVKTPEVRTLKDPPEIWELVHSAPPEFNPGTAFISRATSSWTNRILFGLLLCLIAGASIFAILRFRNAPKAATANPAQAGQTAPATTVNQSLNSPQGAGTNSTDLSPATTAGGEQSTSTVSISSDGVISNTSASYVSTSGRSKGRRNRVPGDNQNAKDSVKAADETQQISPKPDRASVDSADAQGRTKSTPNALSPQLIGPAAPGASPKPKVIQWP